MPVPPDHPTRTHTQNDAPTADHSLAPRTGDGNDPTVAPGEVHPLILPVVGSLPVVFRYEFLGVLAEGGMGIVYRATDTTLGREVAVKVLQDQFGTTSGTARRFVDEARIAGQLQHPAIPAVHDLGVLPDGRPFLAMKLVKGHTLDELLKHRPDTRHDRGRFLAVFEQVCQAVAYAHAHKVIHRDLKPANVMVGNFGEVQVMDWGLAKVLVPHAAAEPEPVSDAQTRGTEIRSIRDSDGSYTLAGSVLGTPAFMPPEQAGGEVARVDERADVFGLGAILSVILTGQPPYSSKDSESVRLMAVRGQLADCFARLKTCAAEPELVALCERCLAFGLSERPRDADAVAKAIAALRAEAEERARRAEQERAGAEARAAEQRKRRRVQQALGVAVALILIGIAAFAWWHDRQSTARQAEKSRDEADRNAEQVRIEGERKADQARLDAERRFTRQGVETALKLGAELRTQYRFREAANALHQAAQLAGRGWAEDLIPAVERARNELAFAHELDDIRMKKFILVPDSKSKGLEKDRFDTASAPPAYRAAYQARGFDLVAGDSADLATRLSSSGVRRELVDALDDWAVYEPDAVLAARLLEVARRADPGPWLERFRDPAVRRDKAKLEQLAKDADPTTTSPATLATLASLMERNGLDPSRVLLAAQSSHPTEFPIAFALGVWFTGRDPRQAVGHLRAARTIRPDNPVVLTSLGHLLALEKDDATAAAAFRESIRLNPGVESAYRGLASFLNARADKDGVIAVWREAVKANPTQEWAYGQLSTALVLKRFDTKGDYDAVIEVWREAVKTNPDQAWPLTHLALYLEITGDRDRAIAARTEAIRIDPTNTSNYQFLAQLYRLKGDREGEISLWRGAIKANPLWQTAYVSLANVLRGSESPDAEVAVWREAIKANPEEPWPHLGLAAALNRSKDWNGAITAWREAIRFEPDTSKVIRPGYTSPKRMAYMGLAQTLVAKGDPDGEVAVWREAIAAEPTQWWAQSGLAYALRSRGDLDGAIAAWQEAIRLDPRTSRSSVDLGLALRDRGDLDEATDEFRAVTKFYPYDHWGHANLGYSLYLKGEYTGSVAEYREALRVIRNNPDQNPTIAKFLWELATVLWAKGDQEEALLEFRAATATNPRDAEAHARLANALLERGDLEGAARAFRDALQFAPADEGFKQSLRRTERMRELLPKLADVAAGRAEPKTPAEACEFATLCQQPPRKQYAAASRLYAKAFAAEPALAENFNQDYRYNAASVAALAGCGRGADAQAMPEDRAALRKQALAWLRTDLALIARKLTTGAPSVRGWAVARLSWHLNDRDLAPVRHLFFLTALPADEVKDWLAYWSDVRSLRTEALKRRSPPEVAPPPRGKE